MTNAMDLKEYTSMLTKANMKVLGSTMKNQVIKATSSGPIKMNTKASSIMVSVLPEPLRTLASSLSLTPTR